MNTNRFLNLVMGNVFATDTTSATPTTYYIGLSTTAPTLSGTNVNEPSGGGYARKSLAGLLSKPSNGVITNTRDIDFVSTGNWGTVTHYVIFDAQSGGNLLIYGALSPSRTIEADTTLSVYAGALTLSLVNPSQ